MAATGKQYAVIEARWTERPSERFVISYSDEESLRDLIAGPNILACGFASLRDAEAPLMLVCSQPLPALKQAQPLPQLETIEDPLFPRGLENWFLSNSDLENSSRIFPGSACRNLSCVLLQKCSFRSNSVPCWKHVLVSERRRPRRSTILAKFGSTPECSSASKHRSIAPTLGRPTKRSGECRQIANHNVCLELPRVEYSLGVALHPCCL
jgi:hypothetical protein